MSFQKKTWLDRQPSYPGRVILTPVDQINNKFDLSRADEPGDNPGTSFSAVNMNDLEERIFVSVPSVPIQILNGGTGASTSDGAFTNFFESGSWIPEIDVESGDKPSNINYTYNRGTYLKWGTLCWITFHIKATITGYTGSDQWSIIKGLPFTSADIGNDGTGDNVSDGQGLAKTELGYESGGPDNFDWGNTNLLIMDLTKNIKIKPYGGLGSVLWYNGIFHIGGTGVYLINTATAN